MHCIGFIMAFALTYSSCMSSSMGPLPGLSAKDCGNAVTGLDAGAISFKVAKLVPEPTAMPAHGKAT